MQFGDVTLPPTLSFFSPSVLIYICLLVFFILILIFITSSIQKFIFLQFSYFFSLSLSHQSGTFEISLLEIHLIVAENTRRSSSHCALMQCTALAQFYAGSQFSLRTRVYACASTSLMFPNIYARMKTCQRRNSRQRRKRKKKKEKLTQ